MPHTPDRQRMRDDLRALAKLAAPEAPRSGSQLGSADSSGYVDLAQFAADDTDWVDRELARAKNGGAPQPTVRPFQTPPSIAPMAVEAVNTAKVAALRPRRGLTIGLSTAGVVCVSVLAVVVMRNAPRGVATPSAAAQAVTAPVLTVATTGVPSGVQPAASGDPIPSIVVAAPDISPPPSPMRMGHGRRAPRSVPAQRAAAAPVVAAANAVPARKSAPAAAGHASGDPLMDAMRAAVKSSK